MSNVNYCLLLVVILVTAALPSISQESPENWFKKNITELVDYSEVDKIINGKKFVFLGESSHGSKEFFEKKSEIIEYLINKHGFEVVLFESPIVATYLYELYPDKQVDSLTHCEHILYPIFVNNEFIEIISYCDSLGISTGGFDVQLGTEFQSDNITEIVYNAFASIDSVMAEKFLEIDKIHTQDYLVSFSKKHEWYKNPYHARGTLDECRYWYKRYETFYTFFKINEERVTRYFDGNKEKTHMVENAILTNLSALNDYLTEGLYYRDSLMFNNIEYLIKNKYQGKKIIFSAHNGHIAKNYHKFNDTINPNNLTFGNKFNSKYGDESCVIAFYGIEGSTNNNKRQPIEMTATTNESNLEYHIKAEVENIGIVDLREYPFSNSTGAVNLCHWGINPEAIFPSDQYDAIIFIQTLTPSTYLDH